MKNRKKCGVWTLVMATVLCLSACGRNGAAGEADKRKPDSGQETMAGAEAYLPVFLDPEVREGEGIFYGGMRLLDDRIHYLTDTGEGEETLCTYTLEDGSMDRMSLLWPEYGRPGPLGPHTFGQDGSLYGLCYGMDLDEGVILVKYDSRGEWAGSWEVTGQLQEENEGEHATFLEVDGQGRICLAGHRTLWLYGADGSYRGSLDLGGGMRVNAMGCGSDGRMYVSYSPEGRTELCTLKRIDFEGKKLDETADNFPWCSGTGLSPAGEGGLLVQDDSALYRYDLNARKKETVLIWSECGVGGSWVERVNALEDGRLLAVLNDPEGTGSGPVLLTGADGEQIPQKETLVMGTLYTDFDSQDAIDRFNRNNDKYTIKIKEYADETALNLDIVSGRCPDIIEFGNLHIEYMIEKGMFEDLNPYLEKSSKLSREDFFEGIMDAYVFDGIQVALPRGFDLYTLIGRTEVVGSEIGWTLEEMLEFAENHPDAVLFDRPKGNILRMLMRYNEELFVDWETGKCGFDSEEFRRLLEFVNRGPEETSYDRGVSYVNEIREGRVLLLEWFMQFEEVQVLEEIFGGEVTFKGFPTPEGTSGATPSWSSAYAITAGSEHKDVAWEFLETFFTESKKHSGWFPGLKKNIEDGLLQAMKINHDGVEYGDYIGEIDGEPYTYRAATQEEVDRILALVDDMESLADQCDREIENMIVEEAEAYFMGQKPVENVMEIIQGRVQMYVSEKR